MHGRSDFYFKLHVHGRIHFHEGRRLCTMGKVKGGRDHQKHFFLHYNQNKDEFRLNLIWLHEC